MVLTRSPPQNFDALYTYASTLALAGGSTHLSYDEGLPGALTKTDLQRFSIIPAQVRWHHTLDSPLGRFES